MKATRVSLTLPKVSALFAALAFGSLTQAVPITFDLYASGNGTVNGSGVYTYTVDGVTLTATAYTGLAGSTVNLSTTGSVSRSYSSAGGAGGLGVDSSSDFSGDSTDQIDWVKDGRVDVGEGLVFSFTSPVQLTSVRFSNIGDNSSNDFDFDFAAGSNPSGAYTVSGISLTSLPSGTWNTNYTGTNFLVAAVPSVEEGTPEDRFRVYSITINTPGTSVPDNASSALLLGIGLLGIGWLSRQRRFARAA